MIFFYALNQYNKFIKTLSDGWIKHSSKALTIISDKFNQTNQAL